MRFKGKIKELKQQLESIEVDDSKEHLINEVLAIMDGSNNPMQEDEIILLRATEYKLISEAEANRILLTSLKTYKIPI